MRHERQIELMNRFAELRDRKSTPLADKVRYQPTSAYTSNEVHARERAVLFRGRYLLAGLTGDAPTPGDYFRVDLDGLPVVVIRGEDCLPRALVNACRHRGAQVFTDDRGHISGRTVSCPFHSWTYDMHGRPLGQPLAREGFRECDNDSLSLRELSVVEQHGLIFVAPVGVEGACPDDRPQDLLGSAEQDIADFDLTGHRLAGSRTRTLPLNWKLVIDTFLESYHIFALHRHSIAGHYFSAPNIYEDFGPGCLVAGVRSDILEEFSKPEEQRTLLPFTTLGYIIYPNTIVTHQIDHIETWQVFPGSGPGECVVTTSIYGRGESTEQSRRYLLKNLDILIGVTDSEDFPQGAGTQRAIEAGAANEFVFGRNEPGLIHYHEWLDRTLAQQQPDAGCRSPGQ